MRYNLYREYSPESLQRDLVFYEFLLESSWPIIVTDLCLHHYRFIEIQVQAEICQTILDRDNQVKEQQLPVNYQDSLQSDFPSIG